MKTKTKTKKPGVRGRPKTLTDEQVKKNRCVRVSDSDLEFLFDRGISLQELVDAKLMNMRKGQ